MRQPLLEDAKDKLSVCESVTLDETLGWGKTVKLTDEAREALMRACDVEIEELRSALDEAKRSLDAEYRKLVGQVAG